MSARSSAARASAGLSCARVEDFEEWLEEDASHRDSAVGVFARFGRSIGLLHHGCGHVLTSSAWAATTTPKAWQPPFHDRRCLQPAGFYDGDSRRIEPFDAEKISEDVSHAWYSDPGRPLHPWDSRTVPARTAGGPQYSYAKATRYDDRVVQLGPLSDLVDRPRSAHHLALRCARDRTRGCGSSPGSTGLCKFSRPCARR